MRMLALDIEQKTGEIERLTDELSGCNSAVLDLLATNARLRKIEEAARRVIRNAIPELGAELAHVLMVDAMALRDALGDTDE